MANSSLKIDENAWRWPKKAKNKSFQFEMFYGLFYSKIGV